MLALDAFKRTSFIFELPRLEDGLFTVQMFYAPRELITLLV